MRSMVRLITLGICGLLTLCPVAWAYGSGLPSSACVSLRPTHGYNQHSGGQHSLDVGSVTSYSAGTAVDVTIQGPTYKAFALQARDVDGNTVGSFTAAPVDTKTMTCTGTDDTITHMNTNEKEGVVFRWIPPTDTTEGQVVYFIATVATSKFQWWSDIRSDNLIAASAVADNPSTQSDNTDQTTDSASQAPDNTSQAPDNTSQGTDNTSQGTDNTSQGTGNIREDPDPNGVNTATGLDGHAAVCLMSIATILTMIL